MGMIPNQQAVTTLVAMVTRKNLGQLTELLFKLLNLVMCVQESLGKLYTFLQLSFYGVT